MLSSPFAVDRLATAEREGEGRKFFYDVDIMS